MKTLIELFHSYKLFKKAIIKVNDSPIPFSKLRDTPAICKASSYSLISIFNLCKVSAWKSAQKFTHPFMNFHSSTFWCLSFLPLRRLKMHKRHAWDSSIIVSQQQWQQQLLCLPLIQTVIMGVLMLVRSFLPKQNNNII